MFVLAVSKSNLKLSLPIAASCLKILLPTPSIGSVITLTHMLAAQLVAALVCCGQQRKGIIDPIEMMKSIQRTPGCAVHERQTDKRGNAYDECIRSSRLDYKWCLLYYRRRDQFGIGAECGPFPAAFRSLGVTNRGVRTSCHKLKPRQAKGH